MDAPPVASAADGVPGAAGRVRAHVAHFALHEVTSDGRPASSSCRRPRVTRPRSLPGPDAPVATVRARKTPGSGASADRGRRLPRGAGDRGAVGRRLPDRRANGPRHRGRRDARRHRHSCPGASRAYIRPQDRQGVRRHVPAPGQWISHDASARREAADLRVRAVARTLLVHPPAPANSTVSGSVRVLRRVHAHRDGSASAVERENRLSSLQAVRDVLLAFRMSIVTRRARGCCGFVTGGRRRRSRASARTRSDAGGAPVQTGPRAMSAARACCRYATRGLPRRQRGRGRRRGAMRSSAARLPRLSAAARPGAF